MKEKKFENLIEFIKAKKHFYMEVSNIINDNEKAKFFSECLSILLSDINIEFKKEKFNNQ